MAKSASPLAQRVVARMEELGISQAEVARRGRFNRAFVSDLVRGKKQTLHAASYVRLARALLTTVGFLRVGEPPTAAELADFELDDKVPEAARTAPEEAEHREGSIRARYGQYSVVTDQQKRLKHRLARDQSQWPPDALYSNDTPYRTLKISVFQADGRQDGGAVVDHSILPSLPMLKESAADNLIAVVVPDGTMLPRYEPGDFVYALVGAEVRPKDFVVIQVEGRSGNKTVILAYVRQLLRQNTEGVVVRQTSPSIESTYPWKRVISVDRIVLSGEAFGEGWL